MDPVKSTLTIRTARQDDVPALAGLLTELGFPAPPDTVAARLTAMLAQAHEILVAVREEERLGLLTVHITPVLHRPTPVGRITALVVTERARGQGIGRALVETAERLLARQGCGLIEVTSNRRLTGAHGFYERLGYETTSLRLKKSLPPAG